MKSPFTGKEMKLQKESRKVSFRKQEIEYTNLSYYCEDTKQSVVTTELDEVNLRQIYNKYRELNNIPFPEEIKKLRQKYGLSAAKMSELFGFGPNQYALYENGEIPSISNAKAIRLADSPFVFKNMLESNKAIIKEKDYKSIITKINAKLVSFEDDFSFEEFLLGGKEPSPFTGYKSPDYNRLATMVAYFAKNLKPQKTLLNKLLFYSDFLQYKNFGSSISGCRYAAIARGPVPDNFRSLFEKMEKDSFVKIKYIEYPDGKVGEQFLLGDEKLSDWQSFSEDELKTLQNVCRFFKGKTTKEVVEISHKETAWLKNQEDNALIDYTYAFDLSSF